MTQRLAEAAGIWEREILPHWAARRDEKRTVQLWRAGLPPKVRGRVWALAIGDTLSITNELFSICLARARATLDAPGTGVGPLGKESTAALIAQDLSRTFPQLSFFQAGGPMHDDLRDILQAYVCYRPDIGYVQGMSFLAAMLLLNVDTAAAAFRALCNMLNRRCHLAFFQMDRDKIGRYQGILATLLREHQPALAQHLADLDIESDLFLYDWFFTVFSRALPLELAVRIWDLYFLVGDVRSPSETRPCARGGRGWGLTPCY